MTVRRALITVACATALAGTVAARQVFKSGTDLVLLNVTVTDSAGHLVTGLAGELPGLRGRRPPDRDQLLERSAADRAVDPARQQHQHGPRLPVAQEAATGFARRLTPKDVAQIIDFDSQAQILQAFTNDKVALEQAIRRTQAGGSTSLFNALYTALSELKAVRAQTTGEVRRRRSSRSRTVRTRRAS